MIYKTVYILDEFTAVNFENCDISYLRGLVLFGVPSTQFLPWWLSGQVPTVYLSRFFRCDASVPAS